MCLDAGTNNEIYLRGPLYFGLPQHRPPTEECPQIVAAIEDFKPTALIDISDAAAELAFQ